MKKTDLPILKHDTHNIGDTVERQVAPVANQAVEAWSIWAVGISDAGRGYEMVRLKPPTGHLVVCYGGEGEVLVNGTWRSCAAGEAYLTPPLQPMAFHSVPDKRWQFVWLYLFDSETALSSVPNPMLIRSDPREIHTAVEGLYLESSGSARIDRVELWAELVHTYVADLIRSVGSPDPLWRLWADVDASLSKEWTVLRLAEKACMQPETLRRACLQFHGRSPKRHVTFLRMRRAEALLRSTSNKLSTIARQVGYENEFAFSTAYSRWKGHSPKHSRATPTNG